ncbi:MAG TPA: hypothetical protein VK867_00015 [Candidatus Limnocylindrales bacterium]|nr:hypothetical protein [Candidatus Limnocylindrales bacterium]
MTDDNIIRLPGSHADEPQTDPDGSRDERDRGPNPASDEEEPNPLLREGPDAPDAADIEDPSVQL